MLKSGFRIVLWCVLCILVHVVFVSNVFMLVRWLDIFTYAWKYSYRVTNTNLLRYRTYDDKNSKLSNNYVIKSFERKKPKIGRYIRAYISFFSEIKILVIARIVEFILESKRTWHFWTKNFDIPRFGHSS